MNTALVKQAMARTEDARTLESRERRNKVRHDLARSMSGRSVVELCLDVPRGGVANEDTERLFLAGLQRLEAELGVAAAEMEEDASGYYGLFVTQLPALLVRRRASRIEGQGTWDPHLSIECYGLASGLGTTSKVPREMVGAS